MGNVTSEEYVKNSKNIDRVMNICDNLFFNRKIDDGYLSREEIVSGLKKKLGCAFDLYYDKKGNHCSNKIQNTEFRFIYQIMGKNSIVQYLGKLRNLRKLYFTATNEGFYSGSIEEFEKDLETFDDRTLNYLKVKSRNVVCDPMYSDNPKIEEDCKFVKDYCDAFLHYMSRYLQFDLKNHSSDERLWFFNCVENDMFLKTSTDPIVMQNMKGVLKSLDSPIEREVLRMLDYNFQTKAFYEPEHNKVFIGADVDDHVLFHEGDHICKGEGIKVETSDYWGWNNYRIFNEVNTEIDSENVESEYKDLSGDECLIRPSEERGDTMYILVRPYIEDIRREGNFLDIIKYAGFEGEKAIDILIENSSGDIIKVIENAFIVSNISGENISEIEDFGMFGKVESKTIKSLTKYLYSVGKLLSSTHLNPLEFEMSDSTKWLLLAVKNIYEAKDSVIESIRQREQKA